MMVLAILSPLIALGLMLALQVLEARLLEAAPTPRGRRTDRRPAGRPRATGVSSR